MDALQQSLAGIIPSYYNKNTNTYLYSTNYGTIEIDGTTKQVKSCCVGFSDYSIQHANKRVVIRILGNRGYLFDLYGAVSLTLVCTDQQWLMCTVSIGIHEGLLVFRHILILIRMRIGKGKSHGYHLIDCVLC